MCCYLLVSCKKVYQQINISPAKRFLLHPLKANSYSKRQCFRCYVLVGKPKKQGVNSALDLIGYCIGWYSSSRLVEDVSLEGPQNQSTRFPLFLWLKHWRLFKGCSIMVLKGKAPCGSFISFIDPGVYILRIFKNKHLNACAHNTIAKRNMHGINVCNPLSAMELW